MQPDLGHRQRRRRRRRPEDGRGLAPARGAARSHRTRSAPTSRRRASSQMARRPSSTRRSAATSAGSSAASSSAARRRSRSARSPTTGPREASGFAAGGIGSESGTTGAPQRRDPLGQPARPRAIELRSRRRGDRGPEPRTWRARTPAGSTPAGGSLVNATAELAPLADNGGPDADARALSREPRARRVASRRASRQPTSAASPGREPRRGATSAPSRGRCPVRLRRRTCRRRPRPRRLTVPPSVERRSARRRRRAADAEEVRQEVQASQEWALREAQAQAARSASRATPSRPRRSSAS